MASNLPTQTLRCPPPTPGPLPTPKRSRVISPACPASLRWTQDPGHPQRLPRCSFFYVRQSHSSLASPGDRRFPIDPVIGSIGSFPQDDGVMSGARPATLFSHSTLPPLAPIPQGTAAWAAASTLLGALAVALYNKLAATPSPLRPLHSVATRSPPLPLFEPSFQTPRGAHLLGSLTESFGRLPNLPE